MWSAQRMKSEKFVLIFESVNFSKAEASSLCYLYVMYFMYIYVIHTCINHIVSKICTQKLFLKIVYSAQTNEVTILQRNTCSRQIARWFWNFLQTFVGDLQEQMTNSWDGLLGGSWPVPGSYSQSSNFVIILTLGCEPTEAKNNGMCGGRDNVQDRGRASLLSVLTSSNEGHLYRFPFITFSVAQVCIKEIWGLKN